MVSQVLDGRIFRGHQVSSVRGEGVTTTGGYTGYNRKGLPVITEKVYRL